MAKLSLAESRITSGPPRGLIHAWCSGLQYDLDLEIEDDVARRTFGEAAWAVQERFGTVDGALRRGGLCLAPSIEALQRITGLEIAEWWELPPVAKTPPEMLLLRQRVLSQADACAHAAILFIEGCQELRQHVNFSVYKEPWPYQERQ